jgi:hypothetical protein
VIATRDDRELLTLLTATGARVEAWAICEQLMEAQDYAGPVRWVIVDDGPVPQPIRFARHDWTLEILRPTPPWEVGQNTQARNLLAGLGAIDGSSRVVLVEDDDWYAPDWLTAVHAALDHAELVGERRARYYHIGDRQAHEHTNMTHASLCSTALRGGALDRLRDVCLFQPRVAPIGRPITFIDMELWHRHPSRQLFAGHRVVGIKGLPGRHGIGVGHFGIQSMADPHGEILRRWIGEAGARLYGIGAEVGA